MLPLVTTTERGLLMLSPRPTLMPTMVFMAMVPTPMPMVILAMLAMLLLIPTDTTERGLLMPSPRPMLMPTMVFMAMVPTPMPMVPMPMVPTPTDMSTASRCHLHPKAESPTSTKEAQKQTNSRSNSTFSANN